MLFDAVCNIIFVEERFSAAKTWVPIMHPN